MASLNQIQGLCSRQSPDSPQRFWWRGPGPALRSPPVGPWLSCFQAGLIIRGETERKGGRCIRTSSDVPGPGQCKGQNAGPRVKNFWGQTDDRRGPRAGANWHSPNSGRFLDQQHQCHLRGSSESQPTPLFLKSESLGETRQSRW